jgi:soluble cytochrome b562
MAKKKDAIRVVDDSQVLRCDLTEEQVRNAAQCLARQLGDKEILDDQLKSIKADMKAKLEKCQAEINLAARLVRDKFEMKNVPVSKEFNYTQGMVTIIRKDCGEIVEARKMTGLEKQQEIDFDGPDKDFDL